MSLKMTTMWTNFAKTGDPNLPVDPDIGCVWNRQSLENKEYLRIDQVGSFYPELNSDYLERVMFWEEIMHKYDFTFGIN